MLTRIEELEIRVGELVKENHELREAGTRLAKENIRKHFALKKQAECNYKLMKEIKWLKTPKVLPVEKTLNVEMLQPVFDIHAEIVRQLSEYRARQLETELIKLPKEFTIKGKMEWIKKPVEEKLEVGKWYDARNFKVEKLKELLPAGTRVAITTNLSEDEQRIREPKSCIGKTIVTKVAKTIGGTAFYVICYQTIENYWFKIIEEN